MWDKNTSGVCGIVSKLTAGCVLKNGKSDVADVTRGQNYSIFSNTMCCLFALFVGGDFVRIQPLHAE